MDQFLPLRALKKSQSMLLLIAMVRTSISDDTNIWASSRIKMSEMLDELL